VFFERGKQRVSYIALIIGVCLIIFLSISSIVAVADRLSTLTLIYFFSYVKLTITIIKYCPQAFMNYRRKSTEGWSIGNILLDLTGGTLSLLQMFLLSINYDDWSSIFGSPTKFGLGLFSILFDLLFIVQHYVLYRSRSSHISTQHLTTNNVDERTPLYS
jgi:cystinosin